MFVFIRAEIGRCVSQCCSRGVKPGLWQQVSCCWCSRTRDSWVLYSLTNGCFLNFFYHCCLFSCFFHSSSFSSYSSRFLLVLPFIFLVFFPFLFYFLFASQFYFSPSVFLSYFSPFLLLLSYCPSSFLSFCFLLFPCVLKFVFYSYLTQAISIYSYVCNNLTVLPVLQSAGALTGHCAWLFLYRYFWNSIANWVLQLKLYHAEGCGTIVNKNIILSTSSYWITQRKARQGKARQYC